MGQHTAGDFILLCAILTATISYAMFRQWREDNAKKSIQRDIKAEWYERNKIKRQ